ncbi:MAG: phosphatase PAP2 family protein [Acidimicrobiia bacterium]|nr:phosphatase PAP2 family protein [Acidimicrobiia bacterium]
MPLPNPDDLPVVRAFDEAVDDALERVRGHRAADRLAYLASESANFSLVWHVLAWLPVLRSRRSLPRAVGTSLALGAESVIVNGWVKSHFRRGRPVATAVRPHRLRVPRTTSFPSGHASSAMVAASLLGRDPLLAPVVYPLAAVVASSRAYVRIHHASDVVGGLVIGAVLGRLARALVPR